MFSLRTTRTPAFLRSVASSPQTSIAARRFASDYGSGEQKQGEQNSAATADKEHPGPESPNTSGGGSKQGGGGSSSSKPQPKILSESPPSKENQSEDVARHNREMDQRADKAHEGVKNEDTEKDKVGKGFWKGQE